MSCLGLRNHLLPSKKARKRFVSALRLKLQRLRQWSQARNVRSHKFHTQKLHHHGRSFQPVYVDELFHQLEAAHVESVELLAEVEKPKVFGKSLASYEAGTSSLSPGFMVDELNDVDLRAEMFIARVKEEMRLQRQSSFLEYQEMLARGV